MRKLGRKKSNREHMIKNLAASLVLYEYIDTTEAKAKEVKSYLEKILARTKENTLSDKRTIFRSFFGKNAAQKIIKELLPRYEGRKSGFTRTFRLKNRLGDNAEMLRVELVDKKVFIEKAADKQIKSEDASTKVNKIKENNKTTVTVKETAKKGSQVK